MRLLIVATATAASVALGTVQLNRAEARSIARLAAVQEPKTDTPRLPPDGRGRVFQIRVVAADTQKPVPNADVRIWVGFDDAWRKTDADGRLDVVHSTGPSDRDVTIDVWGDGRAMQRHQWGHDPNKPIPDSATVPLQPGESLGGLAQDEQGRPISGATILLWSHNYKRKDPHELLFDLRAITGPDGRWRTTGAPATTGELLGFRIDHRDYLSTRDYGDKQIIPKIADLRAGKAVTVMRKGVPIEGRVVDADGKPVAGAVVLSAGSPQEMPSEVNRFAVSTNAAGRFRTGQVKAGEWFLIARAKGHAPADQTIKVGTAVPQVEITLGRPRPLKGRVVDPQGKPIAGAFVNVDSWRHYRCLGVFLWSDSDGRFRWDDASDDEMMVNVSLRGYVGVFMRPLAHASEEVVFTLEPCLSVQGMVRDAETKKRVENATLEFGAVDPKTSDVSQWNSPPQLGPATGVLMGGLNVNLPVTADAYKIRIQSPGYQTFVSRTFRREEKVVLGYEIMLVRGNPTGPVATVLRPDGQPLAGARVFSAHLRGENLSLNDGMANGRDTGGRDQLTGPDGTFALPQFNEPWVVLILGNDAYALASKDVLEKSARIQAKPYARVEGRYLIGARGREPGNRTERPHPGSLDDAMHGVPASKSNDRQ